MKRPIDWFRVLTLIGLGLLIIAASLALGRSPIGWLIPSAGAGEATLSWTAPTTNCNGTALTNLNGYVLSYGQGRQLLASSAKTTTVSGLTPGVWWFNLAATTSDGKTSDVIAVNTTINANEFVVTATDVFTVVKRVDRFVPVKVGTVPLGTVCDATQRVNDMFVVPVAAVTWSGSVRSDVVVAPCR